MQGPLRDGRGPHVRQGVKYPAVLGVGGWNDPRVPRGSPGKFVAAMQKASASDRPVLMKVNYDDGHCTEDKQATFDNFAGQVRLPALADRAEGLPAAALTGPKGCHAPCEYPAGPGILWLWK